MINQDNLLNVIRRTAARFATLYVDDGAERALERATAPGIEGRPVTDRAVDLCSWHEWQRDRLYVRQVAHVVVDRLQGVARGVSQELVKPPLSFSGKQGDAKSKGLLQFRRERRQHGDCSRNMKPANDHLNARRA